MKLALITSWTIVVVIFVAWLKFIKRYTVLALNRLAAFHFGREPQVFAHAA